MNIGNFFTSIPSWALLLMVVIIGVLTSELGAFLGYRKFESGIREPDAPIGTAVSGILGLLAFMLGFTFSSTAARFSERKGLVIAQANAIGEAYLRSGLVPVKQRGLIRKDLTEYTNLLLQIQTNQAEEASLARMDEIHAQLWEQVIDLENENMDPEFLTLFITSVTDIIHLAEERKTVVLVFRIPDALWSALLLLTALSMLAFGYQIGIHGRRRIKALSLLPFAFGLVIVLIADMDSTNIRRFKVSQEPIVNLQKMIRKTSAQASRLQINE